MSRMLWSLALIGFVTIIAMVLGMMFTLKTFQISPSSNRMRLAEALRSKFDLKSCGVELKTEGDKNYVRIGYLTGTDSKFDLSQQTKEMQDIAEFTLINYPDPRERRLVDEVRITRTEIRGHGCFQESFVLTHNVPNPFREQGLKIGAPK